MLRALAVRSTLGLLLAAASAPVWGAPAPALSAQQVLARTADTYRGATGYAWRGTIATHMTIQGKAQDVANDVEAYYGGPSRARFETQANGTETLFLQAGDSVWSYAGGLGQYMVAPVNKDRPQSPLPGIDPFAPHPFAGYARIADGVQSARLLDDAAVTVDGRSVPTYVVDVAYDTTVVPRDTLSSMAPKRFWIDRERFVVLGDSLSLVRRHPSLPQPITIAQMASTTHLDWGAAPADTLFAFNAPAGAARVAQLGKAQDTGGDEEHDPWIGKPMMEFALKDMNGVTRTLSQSRGKVVLLDFWATWCGPCRREMPTIQKLHQRYGAKGLAVFGIDCSEPRSTVASFVAKNRYTIPMLLDQGGIVQGKFQVDGIPTMFVLDKKGTIVAHFVGVHEEDDLVAALKKAGLAIGP
jgi:thiol-disulfide isomerase/thioredoxin/outer membrane lipoprotein-sorting protein